MLNWFYDTFRILTKVYGEGAFIKQAIDGVDVEEKNRALTIKTCYGVLERDIELNYALKYLAPKTPKLAIRTVVKICMYAVKYLNKKPYAVIDNGVELVKKLGKGGASGFVNATLRKFVKVEIPLPTDYAEMLSVKYSYPLFALKKLIDYYGKDIAEKIIGAENPKTTLAFYGVNGEEYLKGLSANYQPTPFDNVYSATNFVREKGFDSGLYTFQALGSVAICDLVEPCESLLDCCAAPGGKSVRLSYKCGKVTSWDIHPHRVGLIEAYARRMGRQNLSYSVKDAKALDKELVDSFDAVLCDAPCSGLGVIKDNPDIALNREQANVEELVKEQRAILNTVKNYVKVGGYLYYSTCSVLPEENQYQVENFLDNNPEFEACALQSKLGYMDCKNGIAFLPHISGGLGFFVTKLKRIK